MGQPTYYLDAIALAVRVLENPIADWVNGMNNGGSCAPGVGINMGEGAIVGTPNQFTLEDQDEAVRVPQVSQQIGGSALLGGAEGKGTLPILTGTNPTNAAKESADPSIDGDLTVNGSANLESLAAGWIATATP